LSPSAFDPHKYKAWNASAPAENKFAEILVLGLYSEFNDFDVAGAWGALGRIDDIMIRLRRRHRRIRRTANA